MAKINRKIQNLKKKVTDKVKRNNYKFKIKDCFVKLTRLDRNKLNDFLNGEKTYNIDINIHNNKIGVGNKTVCLTGTHSANIELKVNWNEMLIECCTLAQPYVTKPKTLTQLINTAWRKCKIANKGMELVPGQIVLAKMKGYSPWPAVIREFNKNKKRIQLYFFGTNNNGHAGVVEVVLFELCTDVVRLLLLRPLASFTKGVREAENILGIDEEDSITNQPSPLPY